MRKCEDSSLKVYERQRGWPTKALMGFEGRAVLVCTASFPLAQSGHLYLI